MRSLDRLSGRYRPAANSSVRISVRLRQSSITMQRENLIVWKHSFSSSHHRVEGGKWFFQAVPSTPCPCWNSRVMGGKQRGDRLLFVQNHRARVPTHPSNENGLLRDHEQWFIKKKNLHLRFLLNGARFGLCHAWLSAKKCHEWENWCLTELGNGINTIHPVFACLRERA